MGGQVRSDQVSDLTQLSCNRSKYNGASPGMAIWLSELKLSRDMWTHPGRVTVYAKTGY